jgi:hypothetical protein
MLPSVDAHFFNTGIADIFALAEQYHSTTGEINNLTSKFVSLLCLKSRILLTRCSWSIFLDGELTSRN